MHPLGQAWVDGHHDVISADQTSQCQACHGLDYRGTPLSRMQASRNITVNRDGTIVNFPTFKNAEVGCYNCHNGPTQSSANTNANPTANSLSTNTINNQALTFALPVNGSNATARIISQPPHGSVGLSNNVATYFPEAGFIGTDTFTFAAWNGSKNSTLATGTVALVQGPFGLTAKTLVPPGYPAMWAAPFTVLPSLSNIVGTVIFDWDFGDGSMHNTNQYATHAYAAEGNYAWSVVSRLLTNGVSIQTTTNTGIISIGLPVELAANQAGNSVVLSWPSFAGDALLEESLLIGPGANWTVCTNAVVQGGGSVSVTVPKAGVNFYRLRKL